MKQINPITFTGIGPDNNPSHFTVFRVWIQLNQLQDGSHRFDLADEGKKWDKRVSMAIWTDEKSIDGMLSNDYDLIKTIKHLKTLKEGVVSLWGKDPIDPSIELNCRFEKSISNIAISFHRGKELMRTAVIDISHFYYGLEHCFTNKELD